MRDQTMQFRHYVVTAVSLVALGANLLGAAAPGQAQSQPQPNRAGLVVQYGDGNVEMRCVAFDEPQINGYELLRRSGLPILIEPGSFGLAVCKIGQQGCDVPAQSCFCECENIKSNCVYWISFLHINGAWKYATLGASNTVVRNGDLQAWVWGSSQSDSSEGTTAVAPPAMTFDQVCAPAQAERTAPDADTRVADVTRTAPPEPSPQAGADTNTGSLIAFGGIVAALSGLLLISATARRRANNRSNRN